MNLPDSAIPYRPHLDGMRALGVLIVIAYHAAWTAGRGVGGMDAFFVVSGFLITTLTLAEFEKGSMSLVRFWARRARRLIPALAVLLVFILFAVRLIEAPVLWAARRSDVVATALYYANWHFLSSGRTYEEIQYVHGSPLLHAWSLAIEEQFYLVFPLLFLLLMRRGQRGRRIFVTLLTVGLIASVFFGLTNPPAEVHYDSRARVFAILAGALTAFAVHYRWVHGRAWVRRLAVVLAPAAPLLVAFVPADMVDDYRWVFLVMVLASCGLLVAGETGGGLTVQVFSWGPLVAIGRRTYGLYLWHLPMLVLLPRLTGVSGTSGTVLAVAATFLLAEMSHRLVETPVRRSRLLARHPGATAAGSLVVVAAIAASAYVILPSTPRWDILESVCEQSDAVCTGGLAEIGFTDAARGESASGWMCPGDKIDMYAYGSGDRSVLRGDPVCVLYQPEHPTLVVGLAGDSTTKMLAPGLLLAAAENNWMLVNAAKDSCPWATPDRRVVDPEQGLFWRCQPSTIEAQRRLVAEFDPDVIIINSEFNTSTDPVPATDAQRDAARRLTAGGATLVSAGPLRWVLPVQCVGVQSRECDLLAGNMIHQDRRLANDLAQLEELAAEFPLVIGSQRVQEVLCPGGECRHDQEGFPLYNDVRHLSYWASVRLAPVLTDLVLEGSRLQVTASR